MRFISDFEVEGQLLVVGAGQPTDEEHQRR
jgi:hypothetical protein